jgi:phenylalanyl-tRNA synthetase beta chain
VKGIPPREPVTMRVARAQKVIGLPITADEMAMIFDSFGFEYTRNGDESFAVKPPSWRFDLEIEEDLIEEVIRGYGFEKIPTRLPVARLGMRAQPEERRSIHAVADVLAARDYHEAINFSFVEDAWERDFAGNADPIRLLNPIAAPLAVMRSSLVGSLVANVNFNANRKASRVRMFEIAKVYVRDASVVDAELAVAGIAQPLKVGGIAWGGAAEEQWALSARNVDFFDVKADVEALFAALGPGAKPSFTPFDAPGHPALHPGRSATITSRGRAVGFVGELHPRWVQRYELASPAIVFEIDAQALAAAELPTVAPVSRFPMVERDLAFVVDATIPVGRVVEAIVAARAEADHDLVRDVKLFDQYRGKGLNENEKSLAFRFWLQDTRQTLDETAIEATTNHIVASLGRSLGARLR